jgi:hypothetical protein
LQLRGDKFTASSRRINYDEFQHWNGQYSYKNAALGTNVSAEIREVMKNILEEIPVPPLQELTHSTMSVDPSEQERGIPELLQEKGLHGVFEDIGPGCALVVFGFFRQRTRRVPYEEVISANATHTLTALLSPIPARGVHRVSLFMEDTPQSPDTPQDLGDLCAALSTSGVQSLWLKDNKGIAAFLAETAMSAPPVMRLNENRRASRQTAHCHSLDESFARRNRSCVSNSNWSVRGALLVVMKPVLNDGCVGFSR